MDDRAHRPYVRWSLWLGAGMFAGLLAGFAVGLGRPRPRHTGPAPSGGTPAGSSS